jgi:hypothetical protein
VTQEGWGFPQCVTMQFVIYTSFLIVCIFRATVYVNINLFPNNCTFCWLIICYTTNGAITWP